MDNELRKKARKAIEDSRTKIVKPGIVEDEICFDVSLLNESTFKKVINYYDSIVSSSVEFLITSLLAAFSGAVGKNVYFKITDSLNIYLNVWGVLIGKSTITRKTTAINAVTKDLTRISEKSYNEYKTKYAKYQNDLAEAKGKKKKYDEVSPLRSYYIFPNDSTVESLTEILSYSQRGLVVHNEFGGFLSQLNRSYSGDSKQFLTNLFDVPDQYEISRATKPNILIHKPFLSILGASTIDWVKENSSPSDLRTGFLARFIYSIKNMPDPNKAMIPLLKLRELTSQSGFYINVRGIFNHLISFDSPVELTIDSEAAVLHCDYDINSYMEMIKSSNENELSFKGRLIIYALKFAGIIALVDKRTTVTKNDMQDGIYLAQYYKRNVEKLLNKEINQTEFSRSEKKILDLIKSKNGKVQHSILLQLSNLKVKDFNEIISNLAEKEKIKILSEKNSYNRSAKYYQLLDTTIK